MEKFIYYVPVEGETDKYEAWTLFFIGDTSVAADYTDQSNYQYVQLAVTDTDLNNFSTKSHTHEVVSDVSVEDHSFIPNGSMIATFTGNEGITSQDGGHQHTFSINGGVSASFTGNQETIIDTHTHNVTVTPSGNVSGSLTGTRKQTESKTTGITLNKNPKSLSTLPLSITPVTSVAVTQTSADRVTGNLEADGGYSASTSIFNGITVDDGVLSFNTKKLSKVTDGVVTNVVATVDASKVTLNSHGTINAQSIATGGVVDDNNGALVGTEASITDNGHKHYYTPEGSVAGTVSGDPVTITSTSHTLSETITPNGNIDVITSITGSTDSVSDHTHTLTPSGSVSGSVKISPITLKHKVDNRKVRTSPDTDDEGSHAYDWYGILFNEAGKNPEKTRVGNMDMHRTLPIQTKMRRCLFRTNGEVYNYLDPNDSTRYANGSKDMFGNDISGQLSELGGTAYEKYGDTRSNSFPVQVMVEIPEHWRKVYRYTDVNDSMLKAMVSPYPQDGNGWIHVPKSYVSAYEAYIKDNDTLCSISNIVGLVLDVDPETGKPTVECDISRIGTQDGAPDWTTWENGISKSLLPTTNMRIDQFRHAARANFKQEDYRWNMSVWELYLAVYWLYVIEYANLDSQAVFTTALSSEGFHQGGLGVGLTNVNSELLTSFNGGVPFVPCGVTNCLGNQSGEVMFVMNNRDFNVIILMVNSYRGIEQPFGHIEKMQDGVLHYSNGNSCIVIRSNHQAYYDNINSYIQVGN